MAIKGYCGLKKCNECLSSCNLDELISCSPDCENLTDDGKINIKECLEVKCEEVKYIFDMVVCSDKEIIEKYGEIAKYPYEI